MTLGGGLSNVRDVSSRWDKEYKAVHNIELKIFGGKTLYCLDSSAWVYVKKIPPMNVLYGGKTTNHDSGNWSFLDRVKLESTRVMENEIETKRLHSQFHSWNPKLFLSTEFSNNFSFHFGRSMNIYGQYESLPAYRTNGQDIYKE